ncbi:MATH domain-containing protein [Ditylenchus destructor]|nr:MATH domain-containing protein [Ditylenchus destructor]
MSEEGIVELKIDRFSEFVRDKNLTSQDRFSVPTYIYGLPWKIKAYPYSSPENLTFFLQCNEEDDDPNWSCQASVKLQIVSQKAGVDDHVRQFDHKYTYNDKTRGYSAFIRCDKLLDPENGFIKDDVVILRAHVKAEMPHCPEMSKLRAFASSISDPPDGTLIVGTNKIPIHKMVCIWYRNDDLKIPMIVPIENLSLKQ